MSAALNRSSSTAASVGDIDSVRFRSVMSRFATGVTVTSYLAADGPAALTANAFMSVSLEPPLVMVSIRKQSGFLAGLSVGSRHGISFLAHDQYSISDRFGGRPCSGDLPPFEIVSDVPLVQNCLARIVARIIHIYPAGDHMLVVSQVEYLEEGTGAPLLFYGGCYGRLGTSD